MLRFLFLGVIRDRTRSLFALIAVVIGVFLTVAIRGIMTGVIDDMVRANAVMDTGHMKVTTEAYAEAADLMPNDLALIGTDSLITSLHEGYPGTFWTPRIKFGGLLDVPDELGETKAQAPAGFTAIDILSDGTRQPELLDLRDNVVRGRMIEHPDEILISDEFAKRLGIVPGDVVTFIGATMFGSFTTYNFRIAGTIIFGMAALDRGAVIVDVEGAREALEMRDAASEVLGFHDDMIYDDEGSVALSASFNETQKRGEFEPVMVSLRGQKQMGMLIDRINMIGRVEVFVFVLLVAIVLWNSGLMNGLRRYGEIGIRLAMGETKTNVFYSLLLESFIIGTIGVIIGTSLGILILYYLQEVGLDYAAILQKSTFIMSNVMRAKITPECFYIGFLPGIVATLLGTALAGRGVYKREMSQLFKELEV